MKAKILAETVAKKKKVLQDDIYSDRGLRLFELESLVEDIKEEDLKEEKGIVYGRSQLTVTGFTTIIQLWEQFSERGEQAILYPIICKALFPLEPYVGSSMNSKEFQKRCQQIFPFKDKAGAGLFGFIGTFVGHREEKDPKRQSVDTLSNKVFAMSKDRVNSSGVIEIIIFLKNLEANQQKVEGAETAESRTLLYGKFLSVLESFSIDLDFVKAILTVLAPNLKAPESRIALTKG